MSLHLVVNLRAGRLKGDGPLLALLRRVAREAGNACILHETGSLADLGAAAAAIAAARPRTVLLAGGDGSAMAGLTALARAYDGDALPRIGLVPGGTVSTVARNYGLRGDGVAYAAKLLARAREDGGATVPAATLRVRADDDVARIAFIFGGGLVARFFELYEADGARGYGGAARIVARIFASSFVLGEAARRVLTPIPATITLDGATAPARAYSLLVAATVRDLGLGLRVTYRAGEDPARVHVVASPLGPRALGPQMPLVLLGRPLLGTGTVDTLAAETVIDFGPAPAPFILDGDLFHARRVTVEPGPTLALLVI
jgi:diacylglycerol kinase (ATP)